MAKEEEKQENKILFLGRVAPIKNLEIVLKAMAKIEKFNFEIVGPAEEEYKAKLLSLIKEQGVENKIKFNPAIFDTKEKIKKLDTCRVFILPSLSEGMPQALVEAMAREKIVVASDCSGNKDLVKDKENGYIFKTHDAEDLVRVLKEALKDSKENDKIRKSAKVFVAQFSWDKIIDKMEKMIKS